MLCSRFPSLTLPLAHPVSMFVAPQTSSPRLIPTLCITGTAMTFPVHHSAPPAMANGWNSGQPLAAWTMRPTRKMPRHMHSWKNMPSPESNFFTGTKFVPKKRTAVPAQIYPCLLGGGRG